MGFQDLLAKNGGFGGQNRGTDTQTDRHKDTQTQTDFIICPMLYAIAMGQIIRTITLITIVIIIIPLSTF